MIWNHCKLRIFIKINQTYRKTAATTSESLDIFIARHFFEKSGVLQTAEWSDGKPCASALGIISEPAYLGGMVRMKQIVS
jgi:hypothetical protein